MLRRQLKLLCNKRRFTAVEIRTSTLNSSKDTAGARRALTLVQRQKQNSWPVLSDRPGGELTLYCCSTATVSCGPPRGTNGLLYLHLYLQGRDTRKGWPGPPLSRRDDDPCTPVCRAASVSSRRPVRFASPLLRHAQAAALEKSERRVRSLSSRLPHMRARARWATPAGRPATAHVRGHGHSASASSHPYRHWNQIQKAL
jgi:hypothetical protein